MKADLMLEVETLQGVLVDFTLKKDDFAALITPDFVCFLREIFLYTHFVNILCQIL